MNYNFFDLLLKKIVTFYYNLFTFNANTLKNSEEMSMTNEEHKAAMVLLKNAAGAYMNCFH